MHVVRLGVVAIACCLGSGCSKETPPAVAEARAASNAVAVETAHAAVRPSTAPAAAMDAAAPAASGAPKFSDAAFDLSLESPTGPVKSGQVSTAEVVLVAKPPFHVNDKYPIKLKLRETAGVKYESLVLGRDAVKLETSKAVMPVAFRAEGSGKRTVAGQFSFSVCTEDKCMIEKRDLSLDINVD